MIRPDEPLLGKPFAIGIENKPWADDQIKQVERYCDYLEKTFQGQWWFGYLSGSGGPPPSICSKMRKDLEDKGKFRTIPFVRSDPANELSIEGWLARCAERRVAERVRWFLRDMRDYVGTTFTNLSVEPDHD
jgi:hypothetical protein